MKYSICVVVIVIFCLSTAFSQDVLVSNVDGAWDNDTKVTIGQPITWTISIFSSPYGGLMGNTNGFAVYLSNDGTLGGMIPDGTFTPVTWTTTPYAFEFFDDEYATYAEKPFGVDGFGTDTIGFGGVSFGDPAEIDGPAWTISTQVEDIAEGKYLCLDSTFFPPGGAWLWPTFNSGTIIPTWSGPHCYLIEDCCQGMRGDVNADSRFLVDDLVYLVDYVFKSGPDPICFKASDVTLDGIVLIDDLVYLVDFFFAPHGPSPPQCE